ncbi:MAG: glycoside hydrolase family 99-like domain-containing protein [Weeksellaceae bacterium]|nr:glycoside hydrolase family 99-like domain-containing protein [Weeksellaceae bacterium]
MNKIRPIAIHLPQFHPFPENDEWWGKGFTEWTNVTKAKPLFEGHYQPHLPADLGFYDLRLEEARLAQEALAKEYGIYGFCYYHYWFNGKRLMNEPIDRKLKNPKEDFPFMLCWANENWTRAWDGSDKEILIAQNYSEEDDVEHIKFLLPIFKDERYIKVDGKPVFLIYRTNLLPDIKKTVEIWNNMAVDAGLKGLYLITVEALGSIIDPAKINFDAAMRFQPNRRYRPVRELGGMVSRILNKLQIRKSFYYNGEIYEYNKFVDKAIEMKTVQYKIYESVTPMWDNSARRKKHATIYQGSTPEKYGYWLDHTVKNFNPFSTEENFVFINAWNEWAEGNHLEPCQKWGRKYLEITKEVLEKY